jgi:spermidine synthase
MNALHPVCFRIGLVLVLLACLASAQAGEKLLYEKKSEYNNVIVTEDANGYRVLRFEQGGARQSIGKPGDPGYLGFAYTKVAFVGLALTREPSRILVVGLGGGTMPMFLRKHYPDAHIDAVDIDPEVVHVAREYFGFKEDERMRVHVGDGRQFVERARDPYDVIFLDAFGTRNVPPHLTTLEFMRAVRKAVKPTGVVVGNIWGRGPNPLFDSMVRTYQEAFEDLYILDVIGTSNKILLALPRKQPLDRQQLAQLARKTGTAKSFQFDLGDIDEEQFSHVTRRSAEGRVLRDAESETRAPRRSTTPAGAEARP